MIMTTTTTTTTETIPVECVEVDNDNETERQQHERPKEKKHHHFYEDKKKIVPTIDADVVGDNDDVAPRKDSTDNNKNEKWGWFAIFIATTVLSIVLDLMFGGILLPESHFSDITGTTHNTNNNDNNKKFDRSIVGVEAFVLNQPPPNRRVMNKIGQQKLRQQQNRPTPTALFLEDWVAKMIDDELYRQSHHKEYEEEWMRKNRRAVLSRIQTEGFEDIVFGDDAAYDNPGDDTPPNVSDVDVMVELQHSKEDFRQHAKDVLLASKSPEQYCADRCVATGHCDVYEDMYDMSPQQVIQFCTECVLSEDEDSECDLPAAFFNDVDESTDDDETGGAGSGASNKLSP